jgi:hypothetical protein
MGHRLSPLRQAQGGGVLRRVSDVHWQIDAIICRPHGAEAETEADLNISDSFIRILENLIIRNGLVKLLSALAGFAAVLLGLGVVIDRETTFRFAVFVVVVVLLLALVTFNIDRRRLYRNLADASEILDRYGIDLIGRQNSSSFHIKEWREQQYIGQSGNTTIHRWFTLVVGDKPMDMFWHIAQMDTERTDHKYQKKFSLEARTFDENQELGVRLPTTTKWTGHSIRAFMFLDRVYEPGDLLRVHLHYEWPDFLKTLIDQEIVEPTEWIFRRKVEVIQVEMSFAKKLGIDRDFHITPYPNTDRPRQFSGADGCHKIEFSFENPPQDTPVGFKVERKK